MKKFTFFVVVLLLSSLASYHLGRASKQYNWDKTSTATVETVAVASPESAKTEATPDYCEPAPVALVESDTKKVIGKQTGAEEAAEAQLLADFSSPIGTSVQDIDTTPLLKTEFSEQTLVEQLSEKFDKATDLSQLALPSADVAKKTIEKLPPHTLAEHLGRYFKPNDLGLIGDQYQFAQKLAQEYLDENPERAEKPSYPSTIHFSLSKQFDVAPATDFQFTKKNRKAAIYAHLNMAPSVVNNSHIFVKWMNLSSGKVMLFNKKRISSRSEQNWVNLRPEKGWRPGAYKVKLYQFDASLTPIVEGQYYVYEYPED